MNLTRRLMLGAGTAPILLGAGKLAAAASSAAPSGAPDVRTFESFGAKGDAPDASGRGTDDTAAIQSAIDWAYDSNRRLPRALLMGDRGYLCGNITLHPTTTIVGTGRQTSMFVCKSGTRGAWFGTRGGGAHKIMLSGFALYGRKEAGLSHILELGTGPDELPLGTESILEGLWLRDAPNGIALAVNGNVAILNDITCQNARIGISAWGNASHAQNIIVMQAGEGANTSQPVIGAEFKGWFVRGLHVEATVERGVPLALRGNTHILHAFISTVTGYQHNHLIDLDDSEYREWSLTGVRLSENRYGVKNGIIRHRSGYLGGKQPLAFSGKSLDAMETEAGASDTLSAGLALTALVLTLLVGTDGLRHRTSAPGRPETAVVDPGPLLALTPSFVASSLEATRFDGGGQIRGAMRNLFVFKTARPAKEQASGTAVIEHNSTGVPLNAEVSFADGLLALVFTHAFTGDPVNLTALPSGGTIAINLRAQL